MNAQKFYRIVLWMRESQRKYDRDPTKANRTIKDASEKAVDKECPNQMADKAVGEFAAKVRDLRTAQDQYWQTFSEEAKALSRALGIVVDKALDEVLV